MLENDFKFVIKNHPNKAVASYKGATANGLLDVNSEKLFNETGSFISYTYQTFTYLTKDLAPIDDKHNQNIVIDGKTYKIKNVVPESKFITSLNLEEKAV